MIVLFPVRFSRAGSQPKVEYTVFVTDSLTLNPLDSVEIELTASDQSKQTKTTSDDGRAIFTPVETSTTKILLSRDGYRSTDTIDVPDLPEDSLQGLVFRVIRISMLSDSAALAPADTLQGELDALRDQLDSLLNSPSSTSALSSSASE